MTLFKCHSHYWSLIMLMLVRSSYWTKQWSGWRFDINVVCTGTMWIHWGWEGLNKSICILCEINPPPPFPTKAYTKVVIKCENRGFWTKKTPFFNQNRWLWGPIIHPFLKQIRFFHNIRFSALFVKVRIYVTASNSIHFFVYVVFFITSKLWLNLKYIYA